MGIFGWISNVVAGVGNLISRVGKTVGNETLTHFGNAVSKFGQPQNQGNQQNSGSTSSGSGSNRSNRSSAQHVDGKKHRARQPVPEFTGDEPEDGDNSPGVLQTVQAGWDWLQQTATSYATLSRHAEGNPEGQQVALVIATQGIPEGMNAETYLRRFAYADPDWSVEDYLAALAVVNAAKSNQEPLREEWVSNERWVYQPNGQIAVYDTNRNLLRVHEQFVQDGVTSTPPAEASDIIARAIDNTNLENEADLEYLVNYLLLYSSSGTITLNTAPNPLFHYTYNNPVAEGINSLDFRSGVRNGLVQGILDGRLNAEAVFLLMEQAGTEMREGWSFSPSSAALYGLAYASSQGNNWQQWEDENAIPVIYFGRAGAFANYGNVPGG